MRREIKYALTALGLIAAGAFGPRLFQATLAFAQNVPCHILQGGTTINFDTGCTWQIADTAVTSTAAELNILDGVTSTAAELNILDGVTATESELDAAADQSAWAALDPGADDALTLVEHGAYPSKAILMSSADGDTFTLPAASGTGAVYTIIVSTTVTSNNHVIQAANATDEFYGVLSLSDSDGGDAHVPFVSLDADGFDTITMNGTTTGGIKGSWIQLVDVAAGHWQIVNSGITCSGTCSDPLSAAVS